MPKKNRKRPSQFQNPLLSNASKTLFANIRFVSIDEKVKTIVVTSTGMDEGKTIVQLMNAAGYDLGTLGNHEFDYGFPQLMENLKKHQGDFMVACNNLVDDEGELKLFLMELAGER